MNEQALSHGLILIHHEEDRIADDFGVIEVIPTWRFLLPMVVEA